MKQQLNKQKNLISITIYFQNTLQNIDIKVTKLKTMNLLKHVARENFI